MSFFKKVLRRKKVKLFLTFLACSFLFWFFIKLSETYTGQTTFDIAYSNIPEELMLVEAKSTTVTATVKATGYQFFRFNFNAKKLNIDISKIEKQGDNYVLNKAQFTPYIKKQLLSTMELIHIDEEQLFFELDAIITKEVPVVTNVKIELAPNYMVYDSIVLTPNKITVAGPKKEIDDISALYTEELLYTKVLKSLNETVSIVIPTTQSRVTFSKTAVHLKAEVVQFSEKIVKVPVQIKNLPEDVKIKTYPSEVSILYRGAIADLKTFDPSSIKVFGDYNEIESHTTTLVLRIEKKPKKIKEVKLLQNKVEFLLKRI